MEKQTSLDFFNTVSEDHTQELESRLLAKYQQDKILKFFMENWASSFTPWEVAGQFNMLITSVRRSITNLTTAGFLTKTEDMKAGPYGKKSFLWKLNIDL